MGASVQRADSAPARSGVAREQQHFEDADDWRRQMTTEASMDLDLCEATARTEKRAGRLAVQGRYHRLPHRITDDYAVEGEVLGTGYSGPVRAATCLRTGTECAVKRLRLRGLEPARKRDLVNEVEVALSVDHPHIVRLLAVYETDRHVYLVMERLTGGEVLQRLNRKRCFSECEAADVMRQMVSAVAYLHGEGVVHRDLKLENFLYEREDSGFVKLIDFGFSRFFDVSSWEKMRDSPGTLTYVAPEVLAQSYRCSACDMWSLGVVAFTMLSGCMPFDQWDPELRRKIRKGKYCMWPAKWCHISAEAKEFVKRLLVVSPRRRMTAEQAFAHPWLSRRRGKSVDVAAVEASFAESCLHFAGSSSVEQAGLRTLAWSMPADDHAPWRSVFKELAGANKGAVPMTDIEAMLSKHLEDVGKLDSVLDALANLGADDGDGGLRYADFVAVALADRAALICASSDGDAMSSASYDSETTAGSDEAIDDLADFLCGVDGFGEVERPFFDEG
eukprot:CAMPEP_0176055340 /NCGR_PEP_ID=MMETSP0120_2-20121206/27549_1 /TAXON_ID=160619 /ORGANISM="Kryptoperidinium foliaceum, Strain CCMP 1326" /LENGTH=503 /DNA_ID=CAMNT_0017388831 /DNA_START=58 /DNA_END=1565 /DNA_ORIENTATION=-